MWMDPNREPDAAPRAGHRGHPPSLGLVLGADDDQCARYARLLRPCHHSWQIVDELLTSQVAMRIDHRTREPGGNAGSTATSDGSPPSGLAASTMPFDSM